MWLVAKHLQLSVPAGLLLCLLCAASAPCNAGSMAAGTAEASPQRGKASLTLHRCAPPIPDSTPALLSSSSPPCQHQLPIPPAPVATGSHSSPVPLHAPPNLASACHPVLDQSAADHTFTHQQHMGSVRQEPTVQQAPLASAEDDPFNSASRVFPQQGLSPGATTDQGLHATMTDSPVSVPTKLQKAATAAAAEAVQHAPSRGSGTGKPVTQTTEQQADTNEVSLPAEQKCQDPQPLAVISGADEADAQELFASHCSTGIGTGKEVTVTADGKTRAADMLGRSTPAQTEPENLPVAMAHAASPAEDRSPDCKAPAAVASGFATGAGKPMNVTARGQAEARKLLNNAAPEDLQQSAAEPMPVDRTMLAASGFTTGTGKAVLTSTAAQARAAHTFADDSIADNRPTVSSSEPSCAAAPAIALSGFSTGTGKAVLMSAAAMAQARKVLADDGTATLEAQLPSISTAAAAPSGFSTGTGKAVVASAAAMARAKKVLADDSTAAELTTGVRSEPPSIAAPATAPSGFSTGTGKAVQFSAAAKACAENLFADDSPVAEQPTEGASEPASAVAPTPVPSGFTSGAGRAVPISAAAQAQARSMFQDENAAPLCPDMGSSSTPAGSHSRPGMNTASARPAIGTPRTGPPISKPVIKRVKELSQSTGGKLFKKPRMSKIVSPFCPGAAPHRVRLDFVSISQQAAKLCCLSTYHRLRLSFFVVFVDFTCHQIDTLCERAYAHQHSVGRVKNLGG